MIRMERFFGKKHWMNQVDSRMQELTVLVHRIGINIFVSGPILQGDMHPLLLTVNK